MNRLSSHLFYGWIIVAFTFVLQFVSIGLAYYSLSVYLKPLSEALNADRFEIALAMSIQSIVVALLSPVAGRLYATRSIKLLLLTGTAAMASGLLLLSQITAVWQLYLLFGGVMGVGLVLLGVIPCNMLLANWFHRRRGTAMGISQFGITISATVLVPLVTWVLLQYGWETAFAVCGLGALIVLTPLILTMAVRSPEERNLFPDGASEPPEELVSDQDHDWTTLRAIKHRDVWALTLVVGPCYLGIAAVVLSLPSHITDIGISAMDAAGVVAVTTLLGAIAKPLFGTLSDFFNKKLVLASSVALQFAGVSVLLVADDLTTLNIAGACFGLGYGGVATLWSVMLSVRFGRAAFAKVMGANMPMLLPFNIFGLPLAAYVYESAGSYIPAFTGLLGGYVVAWIALALFRMEAPKN